MYYQLATDYYSWHLDCENDVFINYRLCHYSSTAVHGSVSISSMVVGLIKISWINEGLNVERKSASPARLLPHVHVQG